MYQTLGIKHTCSSGATPNPHLTPYAFCLIVKQFRNLHFRLYDFLLYDHQVIGVRHRIIISLCVARIFITPFLLCVDRLTLRFFAKCAIYLPTFLVYIPHGVCLMIRLFMFDVTAVGPSLSLCKNMRNRPVRIGRFLALVLYVPFWCRRSRVTFDEIPV
jgi:hypothetical protein